MKKSLRKILTISSAVLMVAGIGISTNDTNINAKNRNRTHRIYRRANHIWHKGFPKAIDNGSEWATAFKSIHHQKMYTSHGKKLMTCSRLEGHMDFGNIGSTGFSPDTVYYTSNHKFSVDPILGTAHAGNEGWGNYPVYRKLSHNKYKIISGSIDKKNPFDGAAPIYIKMYSQNRIRVRLSNVNTGNGVYHRVIHHHKKHAKYSNKHLRHHSLKNHRK